MSEQMFRQALLRRPSGSGGYWESRVWIRAEVARVGKVLRIDFGAGWEVGWEVIEVSDARPESTVKAYEEQGRRGFPSVSGRNE